MLIVILLSSFVAISFQYEVPEAKVEVFHPKGFRVSIPDEEGIKLFAFHGKINEEMNGREGGVFSRDITRARNGRWTFIDKTTKLQVGDVIYYWTYVEYFDGRNKLGYPNDDQEFVVKVLEDPPLEVPAPCHLDVHFRDEDSQLVELTWQLCKPYEGHLIGYKVLYTDDKSLPQREWDALAARNNSTIFKDLKPSTQYYFKVQMGTSKGNGPFSDAVMFKTGQKLISNENQTKVEVTSVQRERTFVWTPRKLRLTFKIELE